MSLADLLRLLLAQGADGARPDAAALRALLEPLATGISIAGPDLERPEWATSVGSGKDLFLDFEGDVRGIKLHDDPRGWGTDAELAVAHGTLADIEPLTGPLRPVPRNPDDFHSGDTVAAHLGERLRVFVEHRDGVVSAVRVHF